MLTFLLPLLALACAGLPVPVQEPPPAKIPENAAETVPPPPEVAGLPGKSMPARDGLPLSLLFPAIPPLPFRETSSAGSAASSAGVTESAMALPSAPDPVKAPEPVDNPRSLSLTGYVAAVPERPEEPRPLDSPPMPAPAEPVSVAAAASAPASDPRLSVPMAAISERPVSRPAETAAAEKTAPVAEKPAAVRQTQADAQPAAAAKTPAQTVAATPKPPIATAAGERIARLGDEVSVSLEGPSFLFLGYADKAKGEEGLAFRARDILDRRTVFTFKAHRLGDYTLHFSQQDNGTGQSREESVLVRILSDPEYALAAKALPAASAPADAPADAAIRENADRLYGLGKNAAALAEYLKVNRDNDAFLIDRIAGIYAKLGDAASAVAYWRKNLAAAPSYREAAVYGIEDAALARGDIDLLMAYLKPLLDLKGRDIGSLLIAMARFLESSGEAVVSQDLLQHYMRRYAEGPLLDEAYFLLGRIYEGNTALRDIRRSRESYQTVVQRFPESALVLKARERIRYIDQHYLYVR